MERRSCKFLTHWLPSLLSPPGLLGYIAAIEAVTSETETHKGQVLCSPCKLSSERNFFVFHSSSATTAVHSVFLLLEINVVNKWKESLLKYFSICKNENNNISLTGVLHIPIIGLALSEASPLSQCGSLSTQLPPHMFAQELILSTFSDALILFKAGRPKFLPILQISNLYSCTSWVLLWYRLQKNPLTYQMCWMII